MIYSLKDEAEASLYEFFKQSWHVIEGHTEFVDEWYLEEIAKSLEDCYHRKIKNLLINLPPRKGKPVGRFTYLQRSDGVRTFIKDINVGDYILTHKGRYRKVLNKYYQGLQDTYIIKTFGNREVVAEGSHPFLTTEGWKEARHLKITDTLATVETREDIGLKTSLEEARLLGYIVGDGCVVANACNVTCADEVQLEDMIVCANKLGFNYLIRKYKRKATDKLLTRFSLSKGINDVRQWLKSHNMADKNSYTKRVPDIIFKSNNEAIANFLGAYTACDGSVYLMKRGSSDIKFEIGSVSNELLVDVNHLLNRLGIRCSVRKKVSNIKTKKQGDKYTSYTLRTCEQDDIYKISKIIPIYGEKQPKILSLVLPKVRFDSEYLRDPILSIESNGKEECYCLEVEDDHTFTANDIIVHNTNLISIAYPAWVWLHNPEEKFYCASYTNSLALKISDTSKLLIESSWFQNNWGDRFKLRRDQNSKSYFANDKTGYRISTSAGAFPTGKGGDILIIDDPNDPSGESEVTTEKVNIWWSQKMYNRVNDARTAIRIIVQQRSQSENDISGNIIKNDIDNLWTKFILPMEYESTIKSNFNDKRTVEGELLSCRDTPEIVRQLKREMGTSGYAAQYQQRPAPLEGGMIKKHWFKLYQYTELPEIEYVLQSWDTALTANDDSAYSACTTWGIFLDRYDNENVILLSCWRDKLEYPELRDRVKRLANDYRDTGNNTLPLNMKYKPDQIVIEAKASGDPLIQDLRRAGVYAQPFVPNKHGDKIQRVRLVTSLIESGIVWMPCQKNNTDKMADFADDFVTSISYFPNVSSRDFVDTMTQALILLRDGNRICHPKDYYEPEEYKEQVRFY